MINLVRKWSRRIMPGAAPSTTFSFDIVKTPKKILAALQHSRKNGYVVGVYSEAFGPGMFLAGIDEIVLNDNEGIVIFKQYEVNGKLLPRTDLAIGELTAICCFNVPYINPVTGRPTVA